MDETFQSRSSTNDLDVIFKELSGFSINNRQKYKYKTRKWSTKHRYFYRVMTSIMGGVIPKFFRYEYFGMENLLQFPEGTPLILVGNHRSHLDAMVAIASTFHPRGNLRYLTSITQGEIQKENFLFKTMRYVGGFPIDKSKPDLSLDYLYETLKANLPVGLFPQGGRIARTPVEDYHKFSEEGRSGVGRIILRLKGTIPVIPIYIHGTAEALEKGKILPKFGSYLSLTFGKAIYFKEYGYKEWDRNSEEFYETARTITNSIMSKLKELCYETEKDVFNLIEKRLGKKLDDIKLSERQSKKLKSWLKTFSHYAPYEFK